MASQAALEGFCLKLPDAQVDTFLGASYDNFNAPCSTADL
jgi:hypothetical protein